MYKGAISQALTRDTQALHRQVSTIAIIVAGARALLVLQLPARRAADPHQIMGAIQLIGGLAPVGAVVAVLAVEAGRARASGAPVTAVQALGLT